MSKRTENEGILKILMNNVLDKKSTKQFIVQLMHTNYKIFILLKWLKL